MIEYGFQRLVLLNSAGYERAELPLDDAVSLVAPNNTGKTSLINALQFLLIIDKRRMDFGTHTAESSRRFYFPHNSAYLLLEVILPKAGTLVLGCVGKGVSHDYAYFAYQGQLNAEDFRLPTGAVVQEAQLNPHFEQLGKVVYRYDATEFTTALYGGQSRRTRQGPDFTVFKLELASHAAVFQKVLTRTLRLDKLKSEEVKEYLLEVFKRDLPDANVDFKAEWEKAFAKVNEDRAQYKAAVALSDVIKLLEVDHNRRLALRGEILHFRPLIDDKLQQWQRYFEITKQTLNKEIEDAKTKTRALDNQQQEWVKEQTKLEGRQAELKNLDSEQLALATRYALIVDEASLENQVQAIQHEYEQQVARVQHASQTSIAEIQNKISRNDRDIASLEQQKKNLKQNLYTDLQALLGNEGVLPYCQSLARDVLSLPATHYRLNAVDLHANKAASAWLNLGGIELNIIGLSTQFEQRSEAELNAELEELRAEQSRLKAQRKIAEALEQAQAKKKQLEQALTQAREDLAAYRRLLELRSSEIERQQDLRQVEKQLQRLDEKLKHISNIRDQYLEEEGRSREALERLHQQHQDVEQQRNQRQDHTGVFDYLADLKHLPWLGEPDFRLDQLAMRLKDHSQAVRALQQVDEQIKRSLREIHVGGLTKYANEDSDEAELACIINFMHHLPQEAESLSRAERSAIVNVTQSLAGLRKGLHSFQSRMKEFNRIVSSRKLSDLNVFKVEPFEDIPLVEAIDLLLSTAEKTKLDDTFDLFNQPSLIGDAQVARAKDLLIKEGEARGCLRVEDLFRLEFIVGKEGHSPESFADIDSAASNGTVLMAKLVTGLALLHLMQDKRYGVQAVCYLDEASSLDCRNQRSLIQTARDFGFALIFASPTPQITARYCVPIRTSRGINRISRLDWQILSPLEADEVAEQ